MTMLYSRSLLFIHFIYRCCCSIIKSCPTLWSHGLQHARLPCPSLSLGICSDSCLFSQWCHPTSSSSVSSFSSCSQSFPVVIHKHRKQRGQTRRMGLTYVNPVIVKPHAESGRYLGPRWTACWSPLTDGLWPATHSTPHDATSLDVPAVTNPSPKGWQDEHLHPWPFLRPCSGSFQGQGHNPCGVVGWQQGDRGQVGLENQEVGGQVAENLSWGREVWGDGVLCSFTVRSDIIHKT